MKLLNGQCEEDFNYYLSTFDICENHDIIHWKHSNDEILKNLPIPIQFGVIQAFADSKGIDLDVKIGVDLKTDIRDGYDYVAFNYQGWSETRTQAQEEAIKHFNKIYNEK